MTISNSQNIAERLGFSPWDLSVFRASEEVVLSASLAKILPALKKFSGEGAR